MNKKFKNTDTLVIVPAFNEEGNIKAVLNGVKKEVPHADILVVDDCSRDGTRNMARALGVRVITHPFHLGYGVSLQTGFKYATKKNYDFIIQMDGDMQHEPKCIGTLLDKLKESDADVVIGSRFLNKKSYKPGPVRRLGMALFASIASLFIGQKITDATSGFRALNKKVVKFYTSEIYPSDFPDADVIIVTSRMGYRIKEVPAIMHKSMNKKSMHNSLKPCYYVFKMLLSISAGLFKKRQNFKKEA